MVRYWFSTCCYDSNAATTTPAGYGRARTKADATTAIPANITATTYAKSTVISLYYCSRPTGIIRCA